MKHKTYTYYFPTKIRFGPGVINELTAYLKGHHLRKPLLVTDPVCVELPFFRDIFDTLRDEGFSLSTFSEIHKNPVKSDVEKGAEAFRQDACEAIIGIGGGASMDVARAIAILAHHEGDLFDYEETKGGDQKIVGEIPHFVTVPTTCGTGSEVGRSTVISDDLTHQKKILFSPRLMASCVFADPLLTMDLPPSVTAATGMDALTHHIESLFAKGFHPMCDGIATEGIKLIWKHLEKATHSPDLESRSAMMIAALMGAVAFQKGLGIVHSMAHPLSTLFDVHHGLANAIMLVHGVRFNAEECPAPLRAISIAIEEEGVLEAIALLNTKLGLPIHLRDIGIQQSAIESLTELAMEDPCHQCNPRLVSRHDFRKLYQAAL